MATGARVTVTLPAHVLREVDRLAKDRSSFVTDAVRREVRHRRRDLRRSLVRPHPESLLLAEVGLDEWAKGLPAEDAALVDLSAGKNVRWVEGEGWTEAED